MYDTHRSPIPLVVGESRALSVDIPSLPSTRRVLPHRHTIEYLLPTHLWLRPAIATNTALTFPVTNLSALTAYLEPFERMSLALAACLACPF